MSHFSPAENSTNDKFSSLITPDINIDVPSWRKHTVTTYQV